MKYFDEEIEDEDELAIDDDFDPNELREDDDENETGDDE